MKKIILSIVLLFSTSLISKSIPESELKLREALGSLWNDHVVWTHEYLVSAINDLPNLEIVTNRLLKNQDDLGQSIVPFYGKDAGKRLAQLLREHILIAADLVKAAKDGNDKKFKNIDVRWHNNAKEIAQFLSKANPNWPMADMVKMLNEHLSLTAQSASAQLKKNWKEDVRLYDEIRKQIEHMSVDFSNGIVKQFPKKFKK